MNWRNTWLLVGVAAALFGFIYLYERHVTPGESATGPRPVLANLKPGEVTSVTLRRGNAFVIGLERTNSSWRYVRPFSYPAAGLAVDELLRTLQTLVPSTYITPQEMNARKQTSADFGFDVPAIALSLQAPERAELRFGARTPGNDQVYLQIGDKAGIYVVNAAILDRLPRSQNDWRDTTLLDLPMAKADRLEITRPAGGFSVQRDPTNNLWRLTRPAHRADQLKVEYLLKQLEESRIGSFITDDPRADLDLYGLSTPQVELTIGSGATTQKVVFGRSPTNDPTQVYARQVQATNVVLVPRKTFDLIDTNSYTEFRDRRLAPFAPELVDTIEVLSPEPFTVKRQSTGGWAIADAPVDSPFANAWVAHLSGMQVLDFVKDVVTDYAPYGLGRLQITLRATVTNGATLTNVVIAGLNFGSNQSPESVYVRRWDEASIYTVRALDFIRMPTAPWQLRDHRVWSFATNQVALLAANYSGQTRQFLRQPNGKWASTTGQVNPFAMDELIWNLGQLTTYAWVARGPAALDQFGFGPDSPRISITVKDGDKPRVLTVQFGGLNALHLPYAATTIDGEPWVFEFPWPLYGDIQRYIFLPAGGGF